MLAARYGEPAALLADVLTLLAAVVASLSSEAVGVQLHGDCAADSFRGCFVGHRRVRRAEPCARGAVVRDVGRPGRAGRGAAAAASGVEGGGREPGWEESCGDGGLAGSPRDEGGVEGGFGGDGGLGKPR